VLFRLAPEIYRQLDLDQDNNFRKYTRGQRYSFDNLRHKAARFADLRNPLKVRSQYNEVVTLRLGPEVLVLGDLQQRGIDATVTATQEFTTPTGRFKFDDVGKELLFSGSVLPGNNRRVTVIRIISSTMVLTEPALTGPDATPFKWELRAAVVRDPSVRTVQIQSGYVDLIGLGWIVTDGLSTFEVVGRRHAHWNDPIRKSFVVQDGPDAAFDITGKLVVQSGVFTAEAIGQQIQTNGANPNNVGVWEITGISAGGPSGTTATVSAATLVDITLTGLSGMTATTVGARLRVAGAASVGNNGTFTITTFLSASSVIVSCATGVFPDAASGSIVWEVLTPPWNITIEQSGDRFPDQTPYYWALLPRAELDLKAVPQPRGVEEKNGLQGSVVGANQFTAADGLFDNADAAPVKHLTVRGSALGNDGIYEVTGVVLPSTLNVTPAFPGGAESGLLWELRRATLIGDLTQVQAYPQPLLPIFVKDFGIEVDSRESEFLQRSNADHVGRWVNIKGIQKAYRVLGELTGMEVSVEKLWRISQELYLQLAASGYSSQLLQVGDAAPGRTGQTGYLAFSGGRVHLLDATAAFLPSDVGLVVRVTKANDPLNSKLYTVDQYVSPTEVYFRSVDGASTPDYGLGGSAGDPMIWWSLERLYTTLEPRRPRMDDMNPDLLTDIVNYLAPPTDTFSMDRWCWEADFSTTVPYIPVSVVPIAGQYLWQVTVATPVGQPGSAEVITVPDHWVFVDALGEEYGIETVPVAAGVGQWAFTVYGVVAPAIVGVNPTYLYYDCPLVPDCDFCASHWVFARIGFGPELAAEIGPAIENIYTRTLERIEQVKPVHVRIVALFVREVEAKLNLTASIEAHPYIYATLVAPITAFYDDFPADVIPADTALLASIETDVSWLLATLDATLNPLFDNYPADDLYSDNSLGASIETP
jgi:hypothetical protein